MQDPHGYLDEHRTGAWFVIKGRPGFKSQGHPDETNEVPILQILIKNTKI